MKKTQQQVFLQVKQKLDYYRLPTIFPYQSVDLLQELLSLLDKHTSRDGKQNKSSNPSSENYTQINDALRHQIGKVVRQNNRLHMEIMSAKQEILTLKHSNDKLLIERSGGSKQMSMLVQAQRKRQDQLFDQLTRVKFKYNQLMDLVHEDSEIEKMYIKRLMKHNKMDLTEKNLSQLPISEIKKGPHQTVTELEAKIILLHNKLGNRQAQIMRLQKRSQYDGLNMNKILKDFQNHRTDNKVSALEQQVNYLEEQNKKMKQEVNSVRKNGGSKEALREEVRKNHETINKLSSQNKQLRKKLKLKDFDMAAHDQEGSRQISKAKNQSHQKQQAVELAGQTIADLKKKVQFYQKQMDDAKAAIEKEQRNNSQLQVLVDKFQNLEAGERILAQYEVQSLKQKIQEYESQLENKKQRLNELKAQNEYHKQEDRLKNEAIENLQKIVDELMRRNNQNNEFEHNQPEYQSMTLENTIALRKNLAQMKQQLASCQNDKQKVQRDFQTLIVRFDQKSKDNLALNDELNRHKIKIIEMKNNEEQFGVLQREVATLQSDLKKQQNFRYRIDQMHQQAENDKTRLRKQLQQLTQQFQIYQKKSKTHLNTLKMQVNELEENNQMLQLMGKEKEKKILILQSHVQQLVGKIKLLKQQITALEDQKINAVRQKHKFQKRCEEMLRVNNQTHTLNKQEEQLRSRSLHGEILEYQHQIKKLHDRIGIQNEQINQLNSYCEAMKLSQENLMQEKAMLKRECEKLKGGRREVNSSESGEEEEE